MGSWLNYALEAGGVNTSSSAVLAAMHPKQRAFFGHPAKRKALIGGRQGGKTRGVAMWLVDNWQRYPGRTSVYITKTAKAAMRRCWPQIKAVIKQFGIRVKYHESDLTATFPNGYVIWCTGAKDQAEADKIRGEAAGFQKIAIDEPATFHDELLEYLITEVAEHTLMQTMGDLLLCGTPGPIPAGFWFNVCTCMGWHVATFTALDNPFLPDPQGFIDQFCKTYGYTLTTPKVLREIFAQWVLDTESLVYITDLQNFIDNNGFYELPTNRQPDFTTLGIDLGYSPDPCSFVIASSWWNRSDIWIRRSYTKAELTPDKIAGEARILRKQFNVHRIIVDGGGQGKTTAAALKLSYGLEVEVTPKGEKRPKIEMMRGAINSYKVRVHLTEAQELVSEYKTIVWNDDKSGHHELCFDHNSDGAIQACLPHRQFALDFEPEVEKTVDSPEKEAAFREAAESWQND